nr:immunoglobulin heavy chain junction region [Mus musculus]MBK4185287.1 immunoglobulin heavy chain junction region [Mus musculus]MBK4185288.1 immunoglobulin heavy chain junction region [Mus musculus]MBK4185289.1 immunoglobulin heavy chain junction region [Mus musculus]
CARRAWDDYAMDYW